MGLAGSVITRNAKNKNSAGGMPNSKMCRPAARKPAPVVCFSKLLLLPPLLLDDVSNPPRSLMSSARAVALAGEEREEGDSERKEASSRFLPAANVLANALLPTHILRARGLARGGKENTNTGKPKNAATHMARTMQHVTSFFLRCVAQKQADFVLLRAANRCDLRRHCVSTLFWLRCFNCRIPQLPS
jgi:hypothetical protein